MHQGAVEVGHRLPEAAQLLGNRNRYSIVASADCRSCAAVPDSSWFALIDDSLFVPPHRWLARAMMAESTGKE